jgi:hypothetical protein
MAAVIDSLAPIPYLLALDPTTIQAPAILAKVLLVAVFWRQPTQSARRAIFVWSVAIITLTAGLVDAAFGMFSWLPLVRYSVFLVSALATLALIHPNTYRTYVAFLVPIPLLGALFHLGMTFAGAVPQQYGRYLYFWGAHPNLGGEIAAVASMAAALSLRLRRYLPTAALLLADCLLLQARAAIVTVTVGILVRLVWADKRVAVPLIGLLVSAIGVATVSGFEPLQGAVAVLQLDDPFRGAGSGFAGRDIRWDYALQLFASNPLLGSGLSLFDGVSAPDPHNAFLYGLASHGLLSMTFWFAIAVGLLGIARQSLNDFLILASGAVLLIFNDRFINLNVYPFAYYIMIIAYPLIRAPHMNSGRIE